MVGRQRNRIDFGDLTTINKLFILGDNVDFETGLLDAMGDIIFSDDEDDDGFDKEMQNEKKVDLPDKGKIDENAKKWSQCVMKIFSLWTVNYQFVRHNIRKYLSKIICMEDFSRIECIEINWKNNRKCILSHLISVVIRKRIVIAALHFVYMHYQLSNNILERFGGVFDIAVET